VINMEDTIGASKSFGTPFTLEKSPLDFANEDPLQMIAENGEAEGQVHHKLEHRNPSAEDVTIAEVVPEPIMEKEVAAMGLAMNKRCRKRGKEETEVNAPAKVLRKYHVAFRPTKGTFRGESPVPVGLDTGSTIFMTATQDAPTSVSDPDPLSYAKPQPRHERDIAYGTSWAARARVPVFTLAGFGALIKLNKSISAFTQELNVGYTSSPRKYLRLRPTRHNRASGCFWMGVRRVFNMVTSAAQYEPADGI
nr:hypothetical protein [Tanacetum cinerariifolium]